jgi:hypothetical protein
MTELWRPVPGFPNYEVSDLGRVWSVPRPRTSGGMLVQSRSGPYLRVHLVDPDGKEANPTVHRLVLLAFAGPCPPGMVTRHGPGGALDNRLANLCWGTQSDNIRLDRIRDGTVKLPPYERGERHRSARLTAAVVAECRRRYARRASRSARAGPRLRRPPGDDARGGQRRYLGARPGLGSLAP